MNTATEGVPARVDFAGGWLDVPSLARSDAYVVNMTITPFVTAHGPYEHGAGIGGSAAWAILNGRDALSEELQRAGWQDPAVIGETGCCVWLSGERPRLWAKTDGSVTAGLLALWWTGGRHDTHEAMSRTRDYDLIAEASRAAAHAVVGRSYDALCDAVMLSYRAQLGEGMAPLPDWGKARKYCGAGWGGYALCMFAAQAERSAFVADHPGAMAIEPYHR